MPTFDQLELFVFDPRREQARTLRRAGAAVSDIQERLAVESYYRTLSLVADIPAPNQKLRARAKDDVRARARELRERGKTYTEIAKMLGVSKSSCSLWCSDLSKPPPGPGKKRASTWGPRLAKRAAERAATKRAASKEIGPLSARELFFVGVALYWAEGAKDKPYRRREYVKFINSEASVIRTFMAWLSLLGIFQQDCSFRVQIHETADAHAAVRFWAWVVGVDPATFSTTTLKRHNPKTNRRNRFEEYHGCLVITVRQSAKLYQRIDGWWQGIVTGVRSGTIEP